MPSPAEMASALDPATAIMQSPVLQVDPMANALMQRGASPIAPSPQRPSDLIVRDHSTSVNRATGNDVVSANLYHPVTGERVGRITPRIDGSYRVGNPDGVGPTIDGVFPSAESAFDAANMAHHQQSAQPVPVPISDQHISDALQRNPGASIFDIAGVNPQAASQSLAAPAVAKSSSGPLGGTPQARAMFEQHIAPHMDEPTFAQQYFAGMHSPSVSFRTDPWNQMTFEGPLVKNGQQIGNISREINPETGEVRHGYLRFNGPTQGAGLGKQLLGNQVDLYNKMGMKSIGLFANIDVGGYAWAKYGFQPKPYDWTTLQSGMNRRLMGLHQSGEISPEALDAAQTLVRQPDPKALWNISDITGKTKSGEPLGKKLLLNQSWSGSLNLKDPETMDRFNAYINKGK